jgi:hypothetical protein
MDISYQAFLLLYFSGRFTAPTHLPRKNQALLYQRCQKKQRPQPGKTPGYESETPVAWRITGARKKPYNVNALWEPYAYEITMPEFSPLGLFFPT